MKSKIAPHLRGYFGMNGELFRIEWDGYFGFIHRLSPKKAIKSFQNSPSQPKIEGLFWIAQNLQRGYFGKGILCQEAILDGKSLPVQTR